MEYIIVVVLVAFSALFSGLTLGFFSLNKDDLERKADLGNEMAKKVFRVRKNGNLLLCTLLVGNVAVNSALSIFLGSIANGLLAGFVATTLIVIFGEIVPQASFSRHALILASKFVGLVIFFIYVFYPICKPIALLLDKVLGEEMNTVYSKKEIIKMIEDHEDNGASDIDEDEERIIKGALSYSKKQVHNIMTPRSEIFALKNDMLMTKSNLKTLSEKGHSRIPVYDTNLDNIVGILYVKDLILKDNLKGKTVGQVCRKNTIFVDFDKPLDDLLNAFKEKKHHMFIVMEKFGSIEGIVTIEDVIEEIIGEEIVDEYDKVEDLREEAKKKLKKRSINKV